jgi:protein-glucosylgalactosylhydroxylysine glucosidase
MTWAMHIVSHLDINEEQEASVLLARTYNNYMRAPFKVWSEAQPGVVGAGNFITGAGGFLQSFINGYAGIRLHFDRLEIVKTFVPPGTTSLKLSGISYLGSVFSVEVNRDNTVIVVEKMLPAMELQMISDQNGEVALSLGQRIIKRHDETLTITRKANIFGECRLPERMLIGAAATLTANKVFLAVLTPLLVYLFSK